VRVPAVELVAAVARNGVIGRQNGLPFRLSTDLKRFKALTIGKPVIMGRKTFESIGKPLPGRINIVISRNGGWAAEGVVTAASLDDAIRMASAAAHASGAQAVCVIGGGEVYAQAIARADVLHITHVDADPDGDTMFPAIDPDRFEECGTEQVPAGEKDEFATRFVTYRRRGRSR
jgi:dihydrofolate reductase